MATSEMIEAIRRLPAAEAARLFDYLFSDASELDRLLAAFDRLPRKNRLSEEEILDLPRAHSAR
ncbi:MAG TPA: hypothetical protein VIK59_07515 [Verrucomicrobiae bacterium]